MIKAKISYLYFCAVGKDRTAGKNEAISKISAFTKVTKKSKIIDDMKRTMEFLYGGGPKFPCTRYLLPDYSFTLKDFKFYDSHIVLSVFEDTGVVEVALNYSVTVETAEELVYLRQCLGSGAGFNGSKNVPETVEELLVPFGGNASLCQLAYLIEINNYHGISLPEKLFEGHSDEIYGIMTGDEGYEFEPEHLAKQRLSRRWSTRDFICAVSFRNNFLLFNFDSGERIKEYREHQANFGNSYYEGPNLYFFLDTVNAGVNHGMLFACENGMVAKTISARVLNLHIARKRSGNKIRREIHRVKELRIELIHIMNRLESVDLAEMSELDRMINDGLDIEPLMEKIKYLLELLESELDLLYQSSTNHWVTVLTVISIIIAALQLAIEFLPIVS